VLFIPLLLIRTGPSASASPEAITVGSRPEAAPPRPHPSASEQRTGRAGHHESPEHRSSDRSGPAATATVAADDVTVSGTVPDAAPARPSAPPEKQAAGPAPAAAVTAGPAGPRTADPPAELSVDPAPPPVTTTTLAPEPGTGEGVLTHGIVTYYDHPAGRCASPWIPFGTTVWITNPANGESVSCVVDDYETDTARSVDLSTATFAEIAPLSQGVIDAELSW
jgi:hypothetical protein